MKNTLTLLTALLLAPLGTLCAAEVPGAETGKVEGKVQVAACYFPNWGSNGEWESIKKARPRFPPTCKCANIHTNIRNEELIFQPQPPPPEPYEKTM